MSLTPQFFVNYQNNKNYTHCLHDFLKFHENKNIFIFTNFCDIFGSGKSSPLLMNVSQTFSDHHGYASPFFRRSMLCLFSSFGMDDFSFQPVT